MKKIIVFGLIALTVSCSNHNSEYINKIKQKVKEDAMGVEMNYKNIEFKWTDTLYVNEKLSDLKEQYNKRINTILEFEYYVKDNFEKGKLFSKSYLTKDRYRELRDWEIKVGHPNQYSFGQQANWVKDGYKNYYEFAFANREASPWISELCNQIEETDSLLNNYENLEEGNLDLIQNSLWFYKRIENYESNNNASEIWNKIGNEIGELQQLNSEIISLSKLNGDQVIFYKALNKYKINNPILNGAEQELKKYFLFNSQLEIIGEEDFKK